MKLNIQLYGGRGSSSSLYDKIEKLKAERKKLKISRDKRFDAYQKATEDTKKEKYKAFIEASRDLENVEKQLDTLQRKDWELGQENLQKLRK